MIPAKIYTHTVPVGGSLQLQVQGEFFKILAATAPVEVRGDTFGTIGPLQPGQGMRGRAFARIELREINGSPNVVSILTAGQDFVDDRVAGEVSIIDGEKARSLAGALFVGTPSIDSLAANYAAAQLWNPFGSGRNLIVSAMAMSSNLAGAILLSYGAVAVGADETGAKARNKLSGTPMGVAQVRSMNTAAVSPVPFWVGYLSANQMLEWEPKGPLVLPPGRGILAQTAVVAASIAATFEWYEEGIYA